MISTSICFALLSLTGGMFLLAKVSKDNLNLFFKIVSWFIIIASFMSIAYAGLRTAMHIYMKRNMNRTEIMMSERFREGGFRQYDWRGFGRRRHFFMDGSEGRFPMHDGGYMRDHDKDDGMQKDSTSVMNKPDKK